LVFGFGITDKPVQRFPELMGVILYARVNKFVQYDVIDHFIRQSNQFHVEVNVVLVRTAPPSGPLISHEHPIITKAVPLA
jgi:hypothetical protein